MALTLAEQIGAIHRAPTGQPFGRVTSVVGLVVEASGVHEPVGALVDIVTDHSSIAAEIVGFRDGTALLLPLGPLSGVRPGEWVVTRPSLGVPYGSAVLGRVLDALGAPIDGLDPLPAATPRRGTASSAPAALERAAITERLALGVRAIDVCMPVGRGQRMGIFAGSGVGKSTLLGMMARNTDADVAVIAMVGERGREVREFIERDLGSRGLERSVLVVATGDQSALARSRCAETAMAIAEGFRDEGKDVLLLMDSVTRYALALREVGVSAGEPPATRGYPPSVFSALPRLLERAGTSAAGSITALVTVLVEGDDMNDPIADAVRGILDGHIVLDRALAHRNHYPAIDVLQSVSRLTDAVQQPEARRAVGLLREALAVYRAREDLIAIGAYARGADLRLDWAVEHINELEGFLTQATDEVAAPQQAEAELMQLVVDAAAVFAADAPRSAIAG